MAESVIASIGRLMPRETVRKIGRLTSSAGMDIGDERAAGLAIIVPILVLIISVIGLYMVNIEKVSTIKLDPVAVPIVILVAAIGLSLLAVGIIYEIIMMMIDGRRKEVEDALPDYLQLVAANVRAGMQLDQAMWYAAKPDFGILAKEMELVSKRVFSGETIEEALLKLSERFQSKYLKRTVDLINEGIVSGGEMASMLEKTAIDLRDMQLMHKEISASMVMYSIFIGFAACFGAPILYVVSYKLLGLFEQVKVNMPTNTAVSPLVKLSTGGLGITAEQFAIFSLAMVVVTGIIACMIMATIQSGKKRNAIKYVLPFILVSLAVFYIARAILDNLFKAFIL